MKTSLTLCVSEPTTLVVNGMEITFQPTEKAADFEVELTIRSLPEVVVRAATEEEVTEGWQERYKQKLADIEECFPMLRTTEEAEADEADDEDDYWGDFDTPEANSSAKETAPDEPLEQRIARMVTGLLDTISGSDRARQAARKILADIVNEEGGEEYSDEEDACDI